MNDMLRCDHRLRKPAANLVHAFSLVELLVVMAIIGMMVGLAVQGSASGRARKLNTGGNLVADLITQCRQAATARNALVLLLVAKNGDDGYRLFTTLELPLGANSWSQTSRWEKLPEGVSVNASLSDLVSPSVNPGLPTLKYGAFNVSPNDCYWQIFLPGGRILSGVNPVYYLTSSAGAGTLENYYKITVNATTGLPIIERP